jgi:hypothetical protein
MSRFAIQAFNFNGTQFGGATGWQYDAGREVDSEGLDGLQYETQHHEMMTKPVADITTRNLKAVIAALNGPTSNLAQCDFPFKAMNGTTGLQLIASKATSDAPGYASGSVHEQRAMALGVLYAAGVSYSQGGKAELRLRGMGRTSVAAVTTDPVQISQVALPTQPASDFGYVLTALLLNNQAIAQPTSFELSIDPKFAWRYLRGYPFPTDIVGAGVAGPTVIQARVSVGDLDLGAGTGTCSAVFTKLASGGGFGTDTVTFTLNGQWSQEQGMNAAVGSDATRDLLVRTRWDGTTRPLTMALG